MTGKFEPSSSLMELCLEQLSSFSIQLKCKMRLKQKFISRIMFLQSVVSSYSYQETIKDNQIIITYRNDWHITPMLQILPKILLEMQPKLSEECWKSTRHAKVPGGGVSHPKCGGSAVGCLWQHVCPQQLQTWKTCQETRSYRRKILQL